MSRQSTKWDTNSTTPTSDLDAYAAASSPTFSEDTSNNYGTSTTELPAHILASAIPSSLPFLGPLSGYTDVRRNRVINERLSSLSQKVKRPLTRDEQYAVAQHTGAGLRTGSWGPTLGVAFGLARWWQTRYEMRWLWLGKLRDETINVNTPPPESGAGIGAEAASSAKQNPSHEAGNGKGGGGASEAPNTASSSPSSSSSSQSPKKEPRALRWDGSRLFAGDRELFRGMDPVRRAAFLQGFRALPYIGLGYIITSAFVGTYAGSMTVVGEINDPRLKNLTAEVRAATEIQQGGIPRSMQSGQSGSPNQRGIGMPRERRDPTGQGSRSSGTLWREHRESISKNQSGSLTNDDDNASPTSDNMFFDDTRTDSFTPDQDTSGSSSWPTTSARQSRNIYERRRPPSQPPQEPQSSSQSSPYDEDSPTGGFGGADDVSSSSPYSSTSADASSSGSSWDRIRERTRSAGASGSGNRSTFSSSEAERNYAKDEAQREFDARVERERRGDDFNSGSDPNNGDSRSKGGRWGGKWS